MGFPEERDSDTESTPRRSRRARDAGEQEARESKKEAREAKEEAREVKRLAREAKREARDAKPDPREPAPAPRPARQTWSPYAEENRSRGPLWFGIGGGLVMVLLIGGLVVMFNSGTPTPTDSDLGRQTSVPLPVAPPGKYSFASARTTDPEPLTLKELFPSKKVTAGSRSYSMTTSSSLKKCADGAVGSKILKALKSGKCTQLVRATFRDKAGDLMGTVGVANLSTSANATKVRSTSSATDYVKPLAGKDSVTKVLGTGSGGTDIFMHGHYAIMVWFQTKDGNKPDAKGAKRITQAFSDITKATVFKALDARTLTGHPAS